MATLANAKQPPDEIGVATNGVSSRSLSFLFETSLNRVSAAPAVQGDKSSIAIPALPLRLVATLVATA